MTAQAITLHDIGVEFPAVVALDGVDHRFEPGTATAIMGANGSGKTTLLDAVAGLRTPSRGSIEGVDRRRLGYVVQHGSAAWMPITVGEVLRMGRYREAGLWRRLRRVDHDAVADAAGRLGVDDLLDRQFGELSGGQQQRVRVAQALTGRPDLLLLDEPINGLDLPSQHAIIEVIATQADAGGIVVMTTHHLDEARHCDEVLLLARRVVAAGPPEDVLTPSRLREAFGARVLGDHEDHDHDQRLLMLDDHGHGH